VNIITSRNGFLPASQTVNPVMSTI